jgi:hypothetical protein
MVIGVFSALRKTQVKFSIPGNARGKKVRALIVNMPIHSSFLLATVQKSSRNLHHRLKLHAFLKLYTQGPANQR